MARSDVIETALSSLILSLSKDEAAARSVDTPPFDKLRMRRLLAFLPKDCAL